MTIRKHPMSWSQGSVITADRPAPDVHEQALAITDPWDMRETRSILAGGNPAAPGRSTLLYSKSKRVKRLKVGDRAVLNMGKETNIEQAGIVRWVGSLDEMVVPPEKFVGVQLDEPVGEHDGVFKRKRFFTCRPSHGVLVPIDHVIRFCPKNESSYFLLHDLN